LNRHHACGQAIYLSISHGGPASQKTANLISETELFYVGVIWQTQSIA